MRYLIILFAMILTACGGHNDVNAGDTGKASAAIQTATTDKQLNLTILLDLSDRIDPKKNPAQPEHYQRDSMLIDYFTSYFIAQMRAKGTYMAKGKLRVMFYPAPADPGINQTAQKLNIDLSKLDVKGKKEVYETMQSTIYITG
jgi:hypothetical protein